MANLLILGAGVMGSALTVPAVDNRNDVLLVGTPLDVEIIDSLKRNRYHPTLDENLSKSITPRHWNEIEKHEFASVNIVILGVSSAGIGWALQWLSQFDSTIELLALVTKGLETATDDKPLTYAHTLPQKLLQSGLPCNAIVGIGGPCIAAEIVHRLPTSVVYASTDSAARNQLATQMQTPTYRVFHSNDIVGVEACAALKNFLAIGVSAMISRYSMPGTDSQSAKNPTAAAFNQAVREMALLSQWIGGDRDSAFDHAGLGDLQVTVGGGRNSKLGVCLGQGMTLKQALQGPLAGLTVEGKDTGKILALSLHAALESGVFERSALPLTIAILQAIEVDTRFDFDFELLASQSI